MILDAGKIVDKVLEETGDNIYSNQERETKLSARHLADMKSDNWLSKSIRPIITIVMLVIWAAFNSILFAQLISGKIKLEDLNEITIANTSILIAVIGFYFNSRKAEKIWAKKTSGAIQIEKMRTRQELRQTRREERKKDK